MRSRVSVTLLAALLAAGPRAAAQEAAPEPAEPPAAEPPAARPPPQRIKLIYEGRAELQKAEVPPDAAGIDDGAWRPVCAAPCEAAAERALYRVGGPRIYPSEVFAVPPDAAVVTVDVDPANRIYHWTGATLAIVGLVGLVVGAGAYLTATSQTGVSGAGPEDWAVYSLLGGPLLAVGGGILWGHNRETVISVRH